MKQKIIILSVLILSTMVGCTRGSKNTTQTHEKKYHNGLTDVNCSHLSDNEKEFASMLSPTHRQVFCKIFEASDRKKAMQLYEKSKTSFKSRGKSTFVAPISPDQAVENVIKAQRTERY